MIIQRQHTTVSSEPMLVLGSCIDIGAWHHTGSGKKGHGKKRKTEDGEEDPEVLNEEAPVAQKKGGRGRPKNPPADRKGGPAWLNDLTVRACKHLT